MKITHVTTRVLSTPADNPLVGGLPAPRLRERSSAPNPALVEEHAGHGRSRNDGGGQTTASRPEPSGRGNPIARGGGGYSPRRGGERDGAADGHALTSPSRSRMTRRRSPPVGTPTIRRRPPQRGP